MSEQNVAQVADKPADRKKKKKKKKNKKKSKHVNWEPVDKKKAKKDNMDHEEPHQNGLVENTMAGEQLGMPGISHRRGIRWLPGDYEEPTYTVVLTGSTRRFVDLRVIPLPDGSLPNQGEPIAHLDWGIAGTSSSTLSNTPSLPGHPTNPIGEPGDAPYFNHVVFSHWLDSRTNDPDADEGDVYSRPNGLFIELGAMVNPATGNTQYYEEFWFDPEPNQLPNEPWRFSIVADLDSPENNAKGRVVRVGEWCQGIIKVGDEVSVERWRYQDNGRGVSDWTRLVRLGRLFVPCVLGFRAEGLAVGNELIYGDFKWVVKEVFGW